jgi:hypothetical protein
VWGQFGLQMLSVWYVVSVNEFQSYTGQGLKLVRLDHTKLQVSTTTSVMTSDNNDAEFAQTWKQLNEAEKTADVCVLYQVLYSLVSVSN